MDPLLFTINIEDMPNATDLHLDLFANDSTGYVIDPSMDIVIRSKVESQFILSKAESQFILSKARS